MGLQIWNESKSGYYRTKMFVHLLFSNSIISGIISACNRANKACITLQHD